MSNKSEALYHKVAFSIGISDSSLGVLYTLLDAEAPCSQYDLCSEWSIPKQTINTAVAALQKKGMVFLSPIPGTRNKKNIAFTEFGRDFAEKTVGILRMAELDALAELSPEERELYHHPKPERKKCLLRLLYLQKPFPAGLLHALYQAQPSGGCRPVCYSTAGAFGSFLFGAGGSYQFGSNQKKPVFPTGRFDYHQGAGAGKSHPIQTVYLSRLERR